GAPFAIRSSGQRRWQPGTCAPSCSPPKGGCGTATTSKEMRSATPASPTASASTATAPTTPTSPLPTAARLTPTRPDRKEPRMNRDEHLDYKSAQSYNIELGDYARLAYHRVGDLIVEDRSLKHPDRAEDAELFLNYTAGLLDGEVWHHALVGDWHTPQEYGLDHTTQGVYGLASSN